MTDKSVYTLQEATEWIAFRRLDLTAEQILDRQAELQTAKNKLQNVLTLNKINITGKYLKMNFIYGNSYDERSIIHINNKSCFDFSSNKIDQYYFVEIDAEDLHRNFSTYKEIPLSNSSTSTSIKHTYTTPYIDLIHEVIEEQGITKDNQPLQKILIDKVKAKMKEKSLPESNNLAKAITTLIRLPYMQKGRAKKG